MLEDGNFKIVKFFKRIRLSVTTVLMHVCKFMIFFIILYVCKKYKCLQRYVFLSIKSSDINALKFQFCIFVVITI